MGFGSSSLLTIAIISAPLAVRYWLGVGLWTTNLSSLLPWMLPLESFGEILEWLSTEDRGEGEKCCCSGTSKVSWWPDSYDGRGGGLRAGGGTSPAGSSTAVG